MACRGPWLFRADWHQAARGAWQPAPSLPLELREIVPMFVLFGIPCVAPVLRGPREQTPWNRVRSLSSYVGFDPRVTTRWGGAILVLVRRPCGVQLPTTCHQSVPCIGAYLQRADWGREHGDGSVMGAEILLAALAYGPTGRASQKKARHLWCTEDETVVLTWSSTDMEHNATQHSSAMLRTRAQSTEQFSGGMVVALGIQRI